MRARENRSGTERRSWRAPSHRWVRERGRRSQVATQLRALLGRHKVVVATTRECNSASAPRLQRNCLAHLEVSGWESGGRSEKLGAACGQRDAVCGPVPSRVRVNAFVT